MSKPWSPFYDVGFAVSGPADRAKRKRAKSDRPKSPFYDVEFTDKQGDPKYPAGKPRQRPGNTDDPVPIRSTNKDLPPSPFYDTAFAQPSTRSARRGKKKQDRA